VLATGDAVYMEDQRSLAEYVLAQDGLIYRGSYKHPVTTPWNFGQVPTSRSDGGNTPLGTGNNFMSV